VIKNLIQHLINFLKARLFFHSSKQFSLSGDLTLMIG